LLALFDDARSIQLVHPASGEMLLRLATPDAQTLHSITIGSDSRFVAAVAEGSCVAVWDLARIRSGLRAIGLDWED